MAEQYRRVSKIKYGAGLLLFVWMMLFAGITAGAEERGPVTLRFLNAYGQPAGIDDILLEEGERALLPVPPEDNAVSGTVLGKPAWKSSPAGTTYMEGGANHYLSYNTARSLAEEKQTGDILYLYSTRVCQITYYDNEATKTIGSPTKAYEGTTVTLKANPTTNVLNKGWSRYKKGTGVWAKFGSSYKVEGDLKLYLVTYARVTYLSQDGKTTISAKEVKKGSSIKLANPPSYSGYRVLGWNIYTNKTTAKYKGGDTVTVTANTRFYVARKALPYTVKFADPEGKFPAAYTKLSQRCAANDTIVFPEVPAANGRVALGWALKSGEEKAKYKAGSSCKITKSTTFYAVYRPAAQYKLTFVNAKGESNGNFEKLNKKVYEGASVKLPQLPGSSGNISKGWNLTLNGTKKLYTAGTTIRVNGNYTFYASYTPAATLVLHYNNGDVYKTITVEKGTSYTLPAMENPDGYTFMGWEKQKNVSLSPAAPRTVAYEAGDRTPAVNGKMDLYAVLFQRNKEGSVTYSQLAKANNGKYSKIIFVGDSRTLRMKKTLLNNMKFSDSNVTYITASGQGLSWFESSGYKQLQTMVSNYSANPDKKVAVVFNLGVNDLGNYNAYVTFMKKIGQELIQNNCQLFYLSVNPINSVMIRKQGLGGRQESAVRNFNTAVSKGLAGMYTYIDTYTWLARTGYSTDRSDQGNNTGVDDGLHYSVNTYKRIYLRVIQTICS